MLSIERLLAGQELEGDNSQAPSIETTAMLFVDDAAIGAVIALITIRSEWLFIAVNPSEPAQLCYSVAEHHIFSLHLPVRDVQVLQILQRDADLPHH